MIKGQLCIEAHCTICICFTGIEWYIRIQFMRMFKNTDISSKSQEEDIQSLQYVESYTVFMQKKYLHKYTMLIDNTCES